MLRPDAFGLGRRIALIAIDFAIAHKRIPYVTLLLAPARRNLGTRDRLGARQVGEIASDGTRFLHYRLEAA